MLKRQDVLCEVEQLIENQRYNEVTNFLNTYINQIEEVFYNIANTLKGINIDNLNVVSDIQQIAEEAADNLY